MNMARLIIVITLGLSLLVGVGAGATEPEEGYINTSITGFIPVVHFWAQENVSNFADVIVTDFYPYVIKSPQGNGTVRRSEHISIDLNRTRSMDVPYSILVMKDGDVIYEERFEVASSIPKNMERDVGPATIVNESEAGYEIFAFYQIYLFEGEGADRKLAAYYEVQEPPSVYAFDAESNIQEAGTRVRVDKNEHHLIDLFGRDETRRNISVVLENCGEYGFHGMVYVEFLLYSQNWSESVEKEFKCTLGPSEQIIVPIGVVAGDENYDIRLESITAFQMT